MRSESTKWAGFIGIVLVMLALIWVPHLVRGATSGHPALKVALDLLPLGLLPLASKVLPSSGSSPIPMKRWAIVLGLIFTAQLALEFSEGRLPQNGYAAYGLFAILILAVLLGTFLILYPKRPTEESRLPSSRSGVL
jgi:hypothetical protein